MKATIISIFIACALIIVAVVLAGRGSSDGEAPEGSNVSIQNGVQVIEIRAKGGYSPRHSVAQAGLPTILRFDTGGTFDCSASVRIPSLGVSKILPQSGSSDIDVGTSKAGRLSGMCGMGMYPFDVEFKG